LVTTRAHVRHGNAGSSRRAEAIFCSCARRKRAIGNHAAFASLSGFGGSALDLHDLGLYSLDSDPFDFQFPPPDFPTVAAVSFRDAGSSIVA
jgi:hypothetical protein